MKLDCFCNFGAEKKKMFHKTIKEYYKAPLKEIKLSIKGNYKRKYITCMNCNHMFSHHKINLKHLYEKDYIEKTYGGKNELKKKFHHIMNLNKTKSDNYFRVRRIIKNLNSNKNNFKICDVGSGLGFFPYLINKKIKCELNLIETDKNNLDFLKQYLKFKNVFKNTDFFKKNSKKKYDLITFNKILEHIENPTNYLKKFSKKIKEDGIIYIEVPDNLAAKKSFLREEFFIEHHHVFSLISLIKMVKNSNLEIKKIGRLKEPSSKYTLFCFCGKKNYFV